MPKVTRKLTETEIRNAKPRNRAYKLYDEGGLMLLVRPTGTKVWQYPYKFGGKYNVATIGQYGSTPDKVGTASARKQRDEIKALLKKGIDPNKNKRDIYLQRVSKSENTFESVVRDWYSKQGWATNPTRHLSWRKLGLKGDVLDGFYGDKPKGTHWRTFRRKVEEIDHATEVGLAGFMVQFGKLI